VKRVFLGVKHHHPFGPTRDRQMTGTDIRGDGFSDLLQWIMPVVRRQPQLRLIQRGKTCGRIPIDDVITPISTIDLRIDRKKPRLGTQQSNHVVGNKPIAEIGNYNDIKFFKMVRQPLVNVRSGILQHRLVMEKVHLEEL